MHVSTQHPDLKELNNFLGILQDSRGLTREAGLLYATLPTTQVTLAQDLLATKMGLTF